MPHIKEGDDIGARFLNNHEDTYEWWRHYKARGEGGGPNRAQINFATVMAANYVDTQVHIGEVCEFDGNPFSDPDLNENYPDPRNDRWLKAVNPNGTRIGWGIALDPIRGASGSDREGGEFLVLGVCHAKVKIVDDEHRYAEREDGHRILKSASAGPVKILHKPSGGSLPETRLCLVQIMDEGGDIVDTVQVYHEDTDPGAIVGANEANVHPGRIRRFDGEMQILEDVWIGFTDRFDDWQGDVLAVQEEFYGPGRRNGFFTVGEDDTRPLYLVTHGARSWDAFAYDEIVAGEAHLVEFMDWDESEEKFMPTGIRYDAQDFFLNEDETQEAGTKVKVEWRGPRLVITGMYCSKSDDEDIEAIVGGS